VCNSGVSLSPIVDGQVYHFAARGLYNGLVLLGDRESGSYWDHITGECVHGSLRGQRLEVFPLLIMNAAQALTSYPNAQVAISKQSVKQKLASRIFEYSRKSERGFMPRYFLPTLGEEDTRLPRMKRGLGVWFHSTRRFYPLERLRAHHGALIDELAGCRLLVYLDPISKVPAALYTDATRSTWVGKALYLNTGEILRGGSLYDGQGQELTIERPMVLATRWYGFAFTFPGCEIYGD
jgi:hypothetical protein